MEEHRKEYVQKKEERMAAGVKKSRTNPQDRRKEITEGHQGPVLSIIIKGNYRQKKICGQKNSAFCYKQNALIQS